MMGKIIVNNKSSVSDDDILLYVSVIVGQGRISNNGKQYCYLVAKKIAGVEVHIVSDLNAKSDKFTAYDAPPIST